MMRKTLLTLLAAISVIPAGAQQFSYPDIAALKASAVNFSAPAPKAGNYYLDENSYDPLLAPASRPGEKLHVIGGTINIPGTDGSLDFARKYRQTAYSRHDLQSDVALAVYTKSIPKTLFNVLFGIASDSGNPEGGTYTDINTVVETPQADLPSESDIQALDIPADEKERLLVQLRNSKLQIDGRINPFRKKEMLGMYKQVIVEEMKNGIQPRFGEPHEWSPEFMKYCREKGEMIPLQFSKLLAALASGVTARHFKTGTEAGLIDYILTRRDASVTIDQLFRASYRLNGGDVYLAILTIENILGDNWRHPRRDSLAVTRKLSNINNFYNGKGDKYGSWYHFHGIMLYGYVQGGLRAALVGGIESAGSHVLSHGTDEQQEDYVNSTGGKIGARLAKALKKQDYLDFVPDRNYCDPNVYLDLTEDFRDRIEFVESKDFKATLTENRMWLKSLYRDYSDCHVEIIYNDRSGQLNSGYIVKRDHVDFRKGKSVPVFINALDELVKARAFISGCLADQSGTKAFGGPTPGHVWVDAE